MSLYKGTNKCVPRIPKRSASLYKSINDDAPRTPKHQECALGRLKGLGTHRGTRLDRPWHRPESIKILLPAWGAVQQDFEGLLWGWRIWRPQPTSHWAHRPRRGGRNVRGRTKRIQIARIYCRGWSCPRQTKITEGESAMPPVAVSSSTPKEVPSVVGQPSEYGRKEILGEAVTSVLNTHS